MKVLHELQAPYGSSFWLSSSLLMLRFGLAGLLLVLFCPRLLRGIRRLEWEQGALLALFAAPGLVLQADGLSNTHASTSAFLTQGYCILLPLWACLRGKTLPSLRLTICVGFVVIGIAKLVGLKWSEFTMGPGESKTLVASLFFTGQILILEFPRYRENRSSQVSLIMFAGNALVALFPTLAAVHSLDAAWQAWAHSKVWLILAALTLGCTLFSFLLMNHWQPSVSATEAGLIYCLEPVFTSFYALFMPAWLSQWTGIRYANESLTSPLLIGGTLILLANVVLQMPQRKTAHNAPPENL
jgi:drug/metabolite transporter (DMT)-like permease